MYRAQRALFAHGNARLLDALGVSSAQLGALYYVAKNEGCSLTDVADVLDMNKSAVSATLRRLESAGMIRREPNPLDGRGSKLFITSKGEDARVRSLGLVRRLSAEATAGLSESEVDTICRFLNAVVARYADPDGRSDGA